MDAVEVPSPRAASEAPYRYRVSIKGEQDLQYTCLAKHFDLKSRPTSLTFTPFGIGGGDFSFASFDGTEILRPTYTREVEISYLEHDWDQFQSIPRS